MAPCKATETQGRRCGGASACRPCCSVSASLRSSGAQAAEPRLPLTDLPHSSITVTATRLDEARSSIQPSLLGATLPYAFTPRLRRQRPSGQENAPLNQVLLRARRGTGTSLGDPRAGRHGPRPVPLGGVRLPEGLSLFTYVRWPRYAARMSLVDRRATRPVRPADGGRASISRSSPAPPTPAPSSPSPVASLRLRAGRLLLRRRSGEDRPFQLVPGQYIHNGSWIDNPPRRSTPIHDDTDQWYGLAKGHRYR